MEIGVYYEKTCDKSGNSSYIGSICVKHDRMCEGS